MRKKKLLYLLITVITLLTEVLIGKFAHGFIRGGIGDVLVIVLIYCGVRTLFPDKIKYLAAYVFIIGLAAEIAQYFHILSILGLASSRLLTIILGGTFSFGDILCYAAGAVICVLIKKAMDYTEKTSKGSD